MTDLETMEAMLTRAQIPYAKKPTSTLDTPTVWGRPPKNGTSVVTGEPELGAQGRLSSAPHGSGYSGFYTEHVFDEAGALWAIWGWE